MHGTDGGNKKSLCRLVMNFHTLLFFSILLFAQNIKSQNQETIKSKKLILGAGFTYGIDRFDENEIREVADDFNLIPYSSPVYEHENTKGINVFAAYEFSDLIVIKMEFIYLPGFKSNYTILDVLLDYERAFFKSDLFSVGFSPGIILNVDEKSKFYFFPGLGVLYRQLKIYQEIRGNNSLITNINPRSNTDYAIMSALSANYFYEISKNINLFIGANYNFVFGKLSRSNFVNISAGITISP